MFSSSNATFIVGSLVVAYFVISGVVAITTGKTFKLRYKYTDESIARFAKAYGTIFILLGLSLLVFLLGSRGYIPSVFTWVGIALTVIFLVVYVIALNKTLEKR